MKKKSVLFALFVIALFHQLVSAQEFHGKIVKSRGDVIIKNSNGSERTPEQSNYIARTDEAINTREGGKAVVKFTNGSLTVIGENSSLGIEKPTLFAHLRGKILFAFAKVSGPSRMVRTDSAVFGVRATSFIVEKDENGDMMALKEGSVNVESPSGAFEIHKQEDMSELEAFKAEMDAGTKAMKEEGERYIQQEKDDYVAFKKSFLLKPDRVIRIKGNRVDESPMGDSQKSDFLDLENFAGEIFDDYRHQGFR